MSKALGLSADEVRSQLRGGKSLNDVAGARGLSHDDLIAAVKAGRPGDAPADPAGVSDEDMAEKIAARKGMPRHEQQQGPAGLRDASKRERLGSLLDSNGDELKNLSASDLVQQLRTKGVDLDRLRSVLDSGDLVDVRA